MRANVFFSTLVCLACSAQTPDINEGTLIPEGDTKDTMSKAWLKDEPMKVCPISGGLPSEVSGKGESANVTNGSAFDCYGFSFGGVSTLVIPDGVEVNESASANNTMIIKTNKTLAFGGHPPKPMSPETARTNMGIAYKIDGETLHIATYGEFSTKEGGASMKLVLTVPAKSKIEKKAEYKGPESAAGTKEIDEASRDYWYTGGKAAIGWTMLKAVPDPGSR